MGVVNQARAAKEGIQLFILLGFQVFQQALRLHVHLS
jgi:hypothetical protein